MATTDGRINDLLKASQDANNSIQKSDEVYTKWADDYDHDLIVLGCKSKEELVKITMAHVKNDTSTLFLDVAAGTGIIAEMLRKYDYKGIVDAVEPNVAMLKKAEKKAAYRKYIRFALTPHDDLPVNNGTYDVVTIAGAIFPGHLEPGCLGPIAKSLKSGGLLVFYSQTTREFAEYGRALKKVLNDMVEARKMEMVKEEKILQYANRKEETGEEIQATLFVYRKL